MTEGPGSGDLGDSVGDPGGGGCDPGGKSVEEMLAMRDACSLDLCSKKTLNS